MKNILGLDLGTNSIGWAKISIDDNGKYIKDSIKLGSRIIPMSQDVLSNFSKGVTLSQTSERTSFRGARRLRERTLLRRERLHRILHLLGFLPKHYEKAIGWDRNDNKTYGKFINHAEPKLAWCKDNNGKMRFLFMDSFHDMLSEFSEKHPELLANGKKIPLDWTIYYLRKKALYKAITKEELAWILLNFNQKRGYYQLRGEEDRDSEANKKEYLELKVIGVEATGEKKGNDIWYNIHLENGWIYRRSSKNPLNDWLGKVKSFIVTTDLDADGNPKKDKDGNIKRSFRAPSEGDWTLIKKRTESLLENSGQTVGQFIYNHILEEPSAKIRGNFIRTIERKYYKDELKAILEKQKEFHHELSSESLLTECAKELYKRNIAHQEVLLKKGMIHLLLNDILFYQRPLKIKKSLIDNCPYENYKYVDKKSGDIKVKSIKCIAKSNPFFQEFRLWQFVSNLRLYRKSDDKDVTSEHLITTDDYANLFTYLNNRKDIKQSVLLKEYFKIKKVKTINGAEYPVRWNYIDDDNKTYPCNETRYDILHALSKTELKSEWLTPERTYRLWHLLYSIESKEETKKALNKLNLSDDFTEAFLTIKPFKKEYGSYSEKAIKKLLSLMRMGYLWSEDEAIKQVGAEIEKTIEGELPDYVLQRLEKSQHNYNKISDFSGLPLWLASYIIYGRHSEAKEIIHWDNPESMMAYIKDFRQHSMRNPIVEQCVLETLRTVHDIWKEIGHIDEIHIELGREMKSTSEQRKAITQNVLHNQNTNIRIKLLLQELKNDNNITGVRPYSPMQQEILRIYEEGALQGLTKEDKDYNDILKISQTAQPTSNELTRYKLWLEQKYRSPYTGKAISLSKLFTSAYQIEHVIPQSRYFDDSLSNKVICESEVNTLKKAMLGMEFIKTCGGQKVHCTLLGDVEIYNEEDYKAFVNEHYSNNRTKRNKLLMEDIPQEFINRQLNDSRYISKMVKQLLSAIVRGQEEVEATSKFVIPCTGGITDRLKKDWGLNDIWNNLVSPRFQRMNALTGSEYFGHWENKEGKRVFQTTMPIQLQQGFSKKRIDHRHHAMDALVIACASRNIISYLNNETAQDTERRRDLRQKLCDKGGSVRKPWDSFTQDTQYALKDIIVTFKNYVRIINKATNYYEHYKTDGKKGMISQKGDELWAIRKPMHKETVFGKVNLRRPKRVSLSKAIDSVDVICNRKLKKYIKARLNEGLQKKQILNIFKELNNVWEGIDVNKIDIWEMSNDKEPMVATRKQLDTSFDEKKIRSISDTGIQKILLNYLITKNNNPELAFTPEGIQEMNSNISEYNDHKEHQPIYKVRVTEPLGAKYPIGTMGNNPKKFVEAQAGTNLYFAIYEDKEGNRNYDTIPLNIAAERLNQQLSPVPETNENNTPLKFYLSPNDLVYVPSEEERHSGNNIQLDKNRIYKMVSSTSKQCFFIHHRVAISLVDKKEFSAQNKMERSIDNEQVMIKSVCWKLITDRLGNIIKVIK